MQTALRTSEVGYQPGSVRVVVLMTDAAYHVAGDGATGSPPITTPNNADAELAIGPNGPGSGEDYPSVAQVKAALQASSILPVFAVTSDVISTYQGLVSQ